MNAYLKSIIKALHVGNVMCAMVACIVRIFFCKIIFVLGEMLHYIGTCTVDVENYDREYLELPNTAL